MTTPWRSPHSIERQLEILRRYAAAGWMYAIRDLKEMEDRMKANNKVDSDIPPKKSSRK